MLWLRLIGLWCLLGSTFALDEICPPPVPLADYPMDYRIVHTPAMQAKLEVVEKYHFTAKVQRLEAGESSHILGDLDFTLNRFPNHTPALMANARYQRLNPQWDRQHRSFECNLQRAREFAPNDPAPVVIGGMHFHKLGQMVEAEQLYLAALKLDENQIEAHYNLGLLYCDLARWDEAKKQADIVYGRQYPLPGLRDKLARAGKW